MDARTRLWATGIVWSAFTLIVISIVTALAVTGTDLAAGEQVFLLLVFALLVAGVTAATRAIWGGAHVDETVKERRGKLKRAMPSRVQRLVDDLDDDEVYELETLLLAREEDVEDHLHRS